MNRPVWKKRDRPCRCGCLDLVYVPVPEKLAMAGRYRQAPGHYRAVCAKCRRFYGYINHGTLFPKPRPRGAPR